MTNSEIDKKIKNTINNSIIVLIFSFLLLAGLLIADISSQLKDPFYWFQRGGSIVVLLSAGIEYKLSQIYIDINPPASSYSIDDQWRNKYGSKFHIVSLATLFFLTGSTIIWGFGDIPFK